MKYKYLSYILTKNIPIYGANASIDIKAVKSISKGDSANVYSFTMENHWGTHVDTSNHFFDKGEKISDYPADFWFFKSPQVISVTLEPSEILLCGEWSEDITGNSDMLLFKAGWSSLRGNEIYTMQNPGIHPEVGTYLRKNFPNIRAIGIDWISISPYQNRTVGREAHRTFLNPAGDNNPIVIIEDMDLSCEMGSLREVRVIPLRVELLDGSPCTVIGVFGD